MVQPKDDAGGGKRSEVKLPAWLINHFNGNDLKIFARCWAAAWVATLLIFIHPALTSLGQATFFGALLLFVVPPAGVLFVYLLASLSLLLGMCLAWAWGLLTMKAALAARPHSETLVKLQALKQQAAVLAKQTGGDPAWEAQILVHDGFMLDARVTVVYYVMGCIFVYALARVRCGNPKLVVMQLFGTIVSDLFLLFGPTLPSFNGSLGSILVKPGAVGIGLGAACCLLFFPQSTSYAVLDKMEKLVSMTEASLGATRRRLAKHDVSREELEGSRDKIIGLAKAMDPALAFLPLDISRCRWNSEDVMAVQTKVRKVTIAALALLDFHISWVTVAQKEERLAMQTAEKEPHEGAGAEQEGHVAGLRQVQESADLMNALRHPDQGTRHSQAVEALERTTGEILQVSSESIKLAARCIRTVNACRWLRKPSQQQFDELSQELQDTLDKLRSARAASIANTTEGVLESYADIFHENGQLKALSCLGPPALRGIVLAMVIEERILGAAVALERLLGYLLQLTNTRTGPRIWLPNRLQYALSWLFSAKATAPVSGAPTDTSQDPDSLKDPATLRDQEKETYRLLRISRGYAGSSPVRKSPVSRAIIGMYQWLFNPAGMYALRMVAVTIATAIPAAIPHSAGFFYREKGIWGVITAQTCVLVYMADFTLSLLSRALGTVLGGAMGMVAWYIGSGSGPGNPYGMAAISAVVIAILVWWRIFLPPMYAMAMIMAGATFTLVIGFSYDQHHIVQYGLPGQGYEAFWKRVVTVLLGFVAAFVVQIFPKPPSSTKNVSKTLANTVRTLSDHYALLLSRWNRNSEHGSLGAVAEEISLEVAETLVSLNQSIKVLSLEISSSPFDQNILAETQDHCRCMNQALRWLLDLLSTLPMEFQERLVRTAGILDDRVIGDIMAVLGIVEQSLRTGSPLPERLPTPLVRQFYDAWYAQASSAMLSTALVRDENYRRYCVALSSYLRFLATIDDLVLVLKKALGECHIVHQWENV